MKNFAEKALFLGFPALAAILGGCLQQDAASDTTQREMNRQNEVANTIQDQYAKMKGQFTGSFNNSDILLTLDVARQSSTGNGDLSLVPQPTLVGNLSFTPRVFVTDARQPLTIPYAVTAGQYVDGNDLTLTVQENGAPTTLHCKVADPDTLQCDWYMNASTAPRASFTLNRVRDGQALLARSADVGGIYLGSNAAYAKIKAEFRTFLEPQNGSLAVPQVAIVGSFVFWPRPTDDQRARGEDPGSANFPFADSEYDPISSTLAIKIGGGNPVEVNCLIRTETTLHCSWIGTHGATSYEDFDLARAN